MWFLTVKRAQTSAAPRHGGGLGLFRCEKQQKSTPGPFPAGPGSSITPQSRGSTIEGPGVFLFAYLSLSVLP